MRLRFPLTVAVCLRQLKCFLSVFPVLRSSAPPHLCPPGNLSTTFRFNIYIFIFYSF